jgi:transcriptional regulator GlxA family with amidase domain
LTAYSSEDVVIKAFRAGATDYIRKPLVLAYLRKKVSDILAGKNGEEPAEDSVHTNREDFLLDGIAAFIENNYSSDLSREMLAEKVCMNIYKFSNVFNERFGQNIKSYVNSIRVRKAAELLKNNRSLCIADIAEAVGYKNIIHFERVFKEIYGLSPKDYRTKPIEVSEPGNILWLSD